MHSDRFQTSYFINAIRGQYGALVAALIGAIWFWGLPTSAAWSCPFCQSEVGQQVQANLFGANFSRDLLSVLAPLLVLWSGLYWLNRWGRAEQSRPSRSPGELRS